MQKHIKLLRGAVKYVLAAILIAVPLYPKFPLINVPGTFVSVRLEDLLILFASLLLFFVILGDAKEFFGDKINRSLILFFAVTLLSVFSGIYLTKTASASIGILHWARRIEYLIPFFLARYAIKNNRSNLYFFVNLILIVVFISFFYGLGQRYLNWPIIITQNEEYSKGVALRWLPGSHINSTFAGHYDLATFLILTLPIIVNFLFGLKGKLNKIVLISALSAGLWLLVNTASRISLLSYLVSASLGLILVKKYKAVPLVIIVSLSFIVFSSNLLLRYGRIIEVVKDRFNLSNNVVLLNESYAADEEIVPKRIVPTPSPTPVPIIEDRSTNIRINVEWPRAIRSFRKNIFLGTGYSSISLATDNDYLRSMGETGILGSLAFALVFVNIIILILKSFSVETEISSLEKLYIAAVIGSFVGIFINAMFIDVFEASKFAIIFWLIIGLSVGLCEKRSQKQLIS